MTRASNQAMCKRPRSPGCASCGLSIARSHAHRKRSAPKKPPPERGQHSEPGPLDVRVTGRRCAPTRIASGNRRLDVLDPGARIPRSDDGICASFCLSNHMVRQYEYQPCIPTRGTEVPAGPDWFHEIKHDCYRLIVQREGKRVRLLTRRGYDWSDRYVAEAALRLRKQSFVVDGEAVVLGPDGISDFEGLHSGTCNEEVRLYAFDLLSDDA